LNTNKSVASTDGNAHWVDYTDPSTTWWNLWEEMRNREMSSTSGGTLSLEVVHHMPGSQP